MREFYVYGFRSRDEYTSLSARSYDNERRRVESWLEDYMQFRQTPEGKTVFLSIDSRVTRHNPLYKAWKTKSFTDGDITLHFILFDILHFPEVVMNLNQLAEEIDARLASFDEPMTFDESTIRKKLKEYEEEGLIVTEKRGRTLYYRRSGDDFVCPADALDFFSEVAPCGVIGSYLLDKQDPHRELFAFKHHYITGALDSEILCALLAAIGEKREVEITTVGRLREKPNKDTVAPLQIRVSAQSGRQYLMAYSLSRKNLMSFRIDNIISVIPGEPVPGIDAMRRLLLTIETNLWGVSTRGLYRGNLEHVEFTVTYGPDEEYIHRRLVREKRCGTVEKLDERTSRFSADVLDTSELVPWIRTFICRITQLSFSNEDAEYRFRSDMEEMYKLYGLRGGDGT